MLILRIFSVLEYTWESSRVFYAVTMDFFGAQTSFLMKIFVRSLDLLINQITGYRYPVLSAQPFVDLKPLNAESIRVYTVCYDEMICRHWRSSHDAVTHMRIKK